MQIIESERDKFWRSVNERLAERSLPAATNGEIDDVIRRTTCPRQGAEFVARLRGTIYVRNRTEAERSE